MAYADIIARIKSDVEAITGIGTVYDYERHIHDDHKLKEIYERGNETITDTGFDDDGEWSGDWTVSGSQASVTCDGANKDLTQANADFVITLTTGNYQVNFDVVANSLSNGGGEIRGICTATALTFSDTGENQTVNITVNSASSAFTLRATSVNTSGTITIDNLSLKRRGKLHAWEISRNGVLDSSDYLTAMMKYSMFTLDGWYALDDSAETEKTFQALTDSICDTLNGDRLLNGNGYIYEPVSFDMDEEMKVGVLCNHARMEIIVGVPVDLS